MAMAERWLGVGSGDGMVMVMLVMVMVMVWAGSRGSTNDVVSCGHVQHCEVNVLKSVSIESTVGSLSS